MYARPLQYGPKDAVSHWNPQAESAFAVLGTLPLGVLAVEAIVGFILLMISVLFFATIFFAFVGMILIYIALWLGVLFNGFGIFVSLLMLLIGWRTTTGKVFGCAGVLIHTMLLGAIVLALAGIHSKIGNAQRVPANPPTVFVQEPQEWRPAIELGEDPLRSVPEDQDWPRDR